MAVSGNLGENSKGCYLLILIFIWILILVAITAYGNIYNYMLWVVQAKLDKNCGMEFSRLAGIEG